MNATKLTYFNHLNSIPLKLEVVDFSENLQKKSLCVSRNCSVDLMPVF